MGLRYFFWKIDGGCGGGQLFVWNYYFVIKLLLIDFISYLLVARGGIEPPTHGFSVRLSQYTQSTVVCYQLLLSIVLSINYSVMQYCKLLSSVTAYRHLYGHFFRNDGHLYGHPIILI